MSQEKRMTDSTDNSSNCLSQMIANSLGQFNVFPLENYNGKKPNCLPFNRKTFYKISLIKGHTKLYYADKNIEFKGNGLLFSSPNIPYAWELVGDGHTGYFCVFTEGFIDSQVQLKEYPVFKPGNNPLFELNEDQTVIFEEIFKNMFTEIESDFVYKYHALRNKVFDLIFSALKLQPADHRIYKEANSTDRIGRLFTELLERQFPIESPNQNIKLRTPSDFAAQLSIHINHLNRTLKIITGKTTSQLISDRIMQESRILLRHTNWNISEIAWSLGFEDLPHFIRFFKKHQLCTPRNYRNEIL